MPKKVEIRKKLTGIPGLDTVLGGGIPEYSFNLIAGGPGTGKTTLAHQIAFASSSPTSRVLFFTVPAEPPLKMLRYQQQFSFFDPAKVPGLIRFVNIDEAMLAKGLDAVLAFIEREVDSFEPAIVLLDSIRTMLPTPHIDDPVTRSFIQRLSMSLTSAQATTFLIGEYTEDDVGTNPLFVVADGILLLSQIIERNSITRKLLVMKTRGQSAMSGLQPFRISEAGIEVFARRPMPFAAGEIPVTKGRVTTGIKGLDEMLHGGFLAGDSALIAGPTGTGKTSLCTRFIAEGVAKGERGVIAVFEERPERYLSRAESLGVDLRPMVESGMVRILYLHPVDLSVDEALHEIHRLVAEIGAQRVAIDSLSGLELSVAPSFRDDFRESVYRTVASLTTMAITVVMTAEVVESFTDLRFSPYEVSFLADTLVIQRYFELNGELQRVMAVVKTRGSSHDTHLRHYEITDRGIQVGRRLRGYRGILSGIPGKIAQPPTPPYPGLTGDELRVLKTLKRQGEASAASLAGLVEIDRPKLLRALDRLVELGYATRARVGRQISYRPATRASKE